MPSEVKAAELEALAERVEKATAGEQEAMLREAYRAIHPEPSGWNPGRPEGRAWGEQTGGFVMMLSADAYLDAAMTLVPWDWLNEGEYFFALEQDMDTGKWLARADQRGDMNGHGDTILSEPCDDKERATTAFALRARAAILKAQQGGE